MAILYYLCSVVEMHLLHPTPRGCDSSGWDANYPPPLTVGQRPRRALGFGLTFPNPKRALGAHGVPHWGSSAPAHHTHPLAMQPAGGAHASSSSIVGGRGRGGREVHLCGAPSGLPLPWFCEWKYLQMCSGGGGREGRGHGDTVLAIQYTLLHW